MMDVYDPRIDKWVESDNPVLVLAYLFRTKKTIDWELVGIAADYCEESMERSSVSFEFISHQDKIPSESPVEALVAACGYEIGADGERVDYHPVVEKSPDRER